MKLFRHAQNCHISNWRYRKRWLLCDWPDKLCMSCYLFVTLSDIAVSTPNFCRKISILAMSDSVTGVAQFVNSYCCQKNIQTATALSVLKLAFNSNRW